MKNLLTSTILTLAAVPFLMASPKAPKQAPAPAATAQTQTSVAKPKVQKKTHVKKVKSVKATKPAAAPAASATPQK
jgi:hypothetical protein